MQEEKEKKVGTAIICIETGERFEKKKDALEKYHIHKTTLRKVLDNPRWTAGGYHWKTEGNTDYNEDFRAVKNENRRPVVCIDTGEEFLSTTDAAEAFGTKRDTVYKGCTRHYMVKGYLFRFKDDNSQKWTEGLKRCRITSSTLVCIETGIIYDKKTLKKMPEIAIRFQRRIKKERWKRKWKGGFRFNSAKFKTEIAGCHWRLATGKDFKQYKVFLRCVETQEIFRGYAHVERVLHTYHANVWRHVHNVYGYSTIKGYHFELYGRPDDRRIIEELFWEKGQIEELFKKED